MLDGQLKMSLVKNSSASVQTLEAQYDRLRQSLAQIGYISQGSVLQRSVATSGRSGYQWTRKVARKTITVSLSQPQFLAMKAAVQNERILWPMVGTKRSAERTPRQFDATQLYEIEAVNRDKVQGGRRFTFGDARGSRPKRR
jgi:hypothetical protein